MKYTESSYWKPGRNCRTATLVTVVISPRRTLRDPHGQPAGDEWPTPGQSRTGPAGPLAAPGSAVTACLTGLIRRRF